MKRFLAMLCAAVLAVCCLSGCSQNDNSSLRVGFDKDFPPMGFVENGEYVGFDLDLAKEVGARLGIDVQLQPIDWASKDMELEAGTINCIWNGFTIDEERLAAYEFTDPYMNNNQIVVVMEDSTINSFADMAGKNVAVQDGSSAIKALEKNTELEASLAEVVKTPDNMTALQDLKSGAVDAVVMDECVARYNIEKQGEGFRVLDEVVGQETFGVGFKKGNTELRDKVENALIEMAQDGTMARISTEWFGKDITTIGK